MNKNSSLRSAERCLRSLSRQITAIQIEFPDKNMVLIGKSDRLLGAANEVDRRRGYHFQPGAARNSFFFGGVGPTGAS